MSTAVLRSRHQEPRAVAVPDLARLDPAHGEVEWVDLQDPGVEDIEELGRALGLHPLALEDALKQRQRPKVDVYRGNGHNFDFLTFFELRLDPAARRLIEHEVSIFVGARLVVTVHRGQVPALEEVGTRWRTLEVPGTEQQSAGFLLYVLLDTFVDSYFPLIDQVSDEVDAMEEAVFTHPSSAVLRDIFALRRVLLASRRILTGEREAAGSLTHGDHTLVTPALSFYFMDVYDHLIRVGDEVDMQRDLLSNLLEGYLTTVSNDLNSIMKTLTAIATILIVLGLITGVYGMNFTHLPGADAPDGFWVMMGLMGAIAGGLALSFKLRGWL